MSDVKKNLQQIKLIIIFCLQFYNLSAMQDQTKKNTDKSTSQNISPELFFSDAGSLMTAQQWESFYCSKYDSEFSRKLQEGNRKKREEQLWHEYLTDNKNAKNENK